MTTKVPVIAIDGPGGAGKGEISRAIARELGWHLLDSGALYRLVALSAIAKSADLADAQLLADLTRNLAVRFDNVGEYCRVFLGGLDVTENIRTEESGQVASVVASMPAVREALITRQRSFQQAPGLVADGRDMGSVVFPDARLKIFLTASVEERARRRYKQLKDKGIDVSLPALSKDMQERDRRDSERSIAPLRACSDARVLDTTRLSIPDVVQTVLQWVGETYP
ncbi:MAG: (d)CMP kinase [Gammaproteobacteria bacterium]|jgi:cytidylate kinase|nr:(d)CMP kinase [Gammaproteobacteria bacterium]